MQTTQAHISIQPGDYDIDPERSTLRFRTRHLFGLGPVRGTFAIRSGAVRVTDPLDASTIFAEIEAGSFRTGNSQRDQTVLSRRFLDPATHPVIVFAAQGTEPHNTGPHDTGPQAGEIRGTLTVRDVERQATLVVTSAEQPGAEIVVTATMHVDRFEFGLTAMRGMAGRYLDLELAAICVPRTGGRHHG